MRTSTGSLAALIAIGFFLVAPYAMADSIFTATLTGAQETPPNGSTATGQATVTLSSTLESLTVSEVFSDLTGGVASGAHIHCCSGPGIASSIALPFPIPPFPAATSGIFNQKRLI